MQGYVSALFKEGYSYSVVQKHCKNRGFDVKGNRICYTKEGKSRHRLASEGKILPNIYRKKKRSSSNHPKVKSLMLKENLPTQKVCEKYIKLLCFNCKQKFEF